jgi:hypothetical protein
MPAPVELNEVVDRFLAQPLGPPSAPSDLTARARKRGRHRHGGIAVTAAVLTIVCVAGFLHVSSNRGDDLAITAQSGTSLASSAVTTLPVAAPVRHVSDSGAFVATVLPSGLSLLHEVYVTDPWYGSKSDTQDFSHNEKRPELAITTIRNMPLSAIKELATVNPACQELPSPSTGVPASSPSRQSRTTPCSSRGQ